MFTSFGRIAGILVLLTSLCPLASAATFTVNTVVDENDGPAGTGISLRDAITSANAVAGAHLIDFAPALTSGGPATIALTTGTLRIGQAMTINGPGRDLLSVSGQNTTRVLDILANTTATINGLTIRDGFTTAGVEGTGAGIRVRGALIMDRCRVTSNTAVTFGGGIDADTSGALTITHTEISQNRSIESAGIRHTSTEPFVLSDCSVTSNTATTITGGLDLFVFNGPVDIRRCNISYNTALVAGGIYTSQPTFLGDSTIEGNVATNAGGGIVLAGISVATISNCTITSNSTAFQGGGILATNNLTTATLQNVTITSNSASSGVAAADGGGIFSTTPALRLSNCVIAGNTDSTTQGIIFPDIFGPVTSLGHNFIGDAGTTPTVVNGINGDQAGYTTAPLNALLGPLADNGGPTKTHHPLPGSPLINAGDNGQVTTATTAGPPFLDQRGAGRIREGFVDIGAVEQQPVPIPNPDFYSTDEDVLLSVVSPGVLSNDNFAMSAELVSTTSHGTLTLDTDGSFSYVPAADFNGTDSFVYRAKNVDETGAPTTATITVTPVNDSPSIIVPGAKTVNEDTQLNITGVSVSDVDAGSANINMTLSVSHGTITLTNGSLTVTGNGTTSVSMTGSVANINTRLSNVRYQGVSNYNGPDLLLVEANDQGNTGTGGPKTDLRSIAITVTPVSDAHLTIDKSAVAQVSDAGSTITYTILVTNTGIEPTGGNVVIRDTPPAGLVLVSATASGGTVTTESVGVAPFYQLVDTLLPLAPAASETFTLVFTVDGAGTYSNTASATSPEGTVSDTVDVNLCPAASFTPAGDCSALPDLAASWTVAPVLAKGKLKGKALVTNQGNADALNATMVIVLSNDDCPGISDQLLTTKLLKKLKPGKSKKVNLSFKVADPATVSGKLPIIHVDGGNAVPECNESNNFAVSGQLP